MYRFQVTTLLLLLEEIHMSVHMHVSTMEGKKLNVLK